MRIPTEHFAHVPVALLSPSLLPSPDDEPHSFPRSLVARLVSPDHNVSTHTRTHIHTRARARTHARTHTHTHARTHTHMCKYIYAYAWVNIHVRYVCALIYT